MYQNSPRNARACSSPLEAARSVLIDRLLDRSAESSPLVKDDLKLCEGPEARSLKCEIETCLAKRTAHLSLFGTATPKVHILLSLIHI